MKEETNVSLQSPFADLNRTPLMHLNPNSKENCNDPHRLLELALRFSRPWEERVGLPNPTEVIADTFDVDEGDPLVALLMDNPVEEYRAGDLFVDGDPETTVVRVFTIHNAKDIASCLEGRANKEDGFWRSELLHFNDSEPHLFVADGHLYVSPDYLNKNLLLWDGESYHLIKHKEHDVYIPPKHCLFGEEKELVTFGGYYVRDRIAAEVKLINLLVQGPWKGRITPDLLVGVPYFILQNVHLFFGEVIDDTMEMIRTLLAGGKND